MICKNWCNISGTNMNSSRLLTLTLIISFLMTSGAFANDQRSKSSSISDATAEKLTQNKPSNRENHFFVEGDGDDEVEGSGNRGEIHDALERDNDDIDSSGSGYGDDEDEDIHTPKRVNKEPPTNTHHSGDGSDHRVDSDADEDYDDHENHEDKKPLHIDVDDDKFFFVNSTSTDNNLAPTTTDDEDIGNDFTNRQREIEYPTRSETDQSNHVPVVPTETPNSGTGENGVLIMEKDESRPTSFFAQPGILAAVVGGAVVGLLFAILVVMFIVYRMRKKDEGSYALDEPKRSPQANSYTKNHNNREFYA